MPTILLREALEKGMCSAYQAAGSNRGALKNALDTLIKIGVFTCLEDENWRTQVANVNKVPYEDLPWFHKCLAGIGRMANYFNPTDHSSATVSLTPKDWASELSAVVIRDKSTGAFVEPVYDFYSPQYYVPMHSIIAAYMMGKREPVKIDTISVIGDYTDSKVWPIQVDVIEDAINKLMAAFPTPGGACFSCATQGCQFKVSFEDKVYTWMKVRQTLDEIEGELREHLTFKGPTKVGAHLVYMKEGKRRQFDDSKFEQWIQNLVSEKPGNWKLFVKPDLAAVARGIEKGWLPKEFAGPISEARYYTIETSLSL